MGLSGKILYLHGYGSNGSSDTAAVIRELFPDYQVISPTYTYLDPMNAAEQLGRLCEDNVFDLIIGSSLGGFWSMYLGQEHCIPALAINPSVNASENLKKYNIDGLSSLYEEFETYLVMCLTDHDREPCTVILGSNDDVIPNQPVEFLREKVKVVNTDWEHRMPKSPEATVLIRGLGDELMGNIIGCQG